MRSNTERFIVPSSWKSGAIRQRRALLALTIIAVIGVVISILADENSASIRSSVAIMCGMLALISLISRVAFWGSGSPSEVGASVHAPDGRSVTYFHESSTAIVSRLVASLGMGGLFIVTYISRQDFYESDSSTWADGRLLFAARLAPFLAALVVIHLLFFFLGRRKVIAVGMDRTGVYNWWWGGCSYFPWEWISTFKIQHNKPFGARADIVPLKRLVGYSNPEENPLGRVPKIRHGMRHLQLGSSRIHPGLLYQALCFYLRHPELREELDDRRAIERMERDDYPEIAEEIRTHGYAFPPDSNPQ